MHVVSVRGQYCIPNTWSERRMRIVSRIELPVVPDFSGHADLPLHGEQAAQNKLDALFDALRRYRAQGALIAFSGGVDSAFLVWAAAQVADGGGRVVALTTVSPSTPGPDLEDASAFAASLGVDHLCVESHELDLEEYARNDAERCYHCKSDLFVTARSVARERGLAWVLYGYTASDTTSAANSLIGWLSQNTDSLQGR